MAHAGILTEDDRVELIAGRIIAMSPIGSRHAECVRRIDHLFVRALHPHAYVSSQNPIRLDDRSEPEPDVALLVPEEAYAERHPRPEEVLLLVEVSDTTLDFDRSVKVPLYARAGIREFWIVALEEERIYVYRNPREGGYAEVEAFGRGATVRIAALPEAGPFAVDDLLVP